MADEVRSPGRRLLARQPHLQHPQFTGLCPHEAQSLWYGFAHAQCFRSVPCGQLQLVFEQFPHIVLASPSRSSFCSSITFTSPRGGEPPHQWPWRISLSSQPRWRCCWGRDYDVRLHHADGSMVMDPVFVLAVIVRVAEALRETPTSTVPTIALVVTL